MKRSIKILSCILVVICLFSFSEKDNLSKRKYEIKIIPSFVAPCKIEITTENGSGNLKFTRYKFNYDTTKVDFIKTFKLTKNEMELFSKRVSEIDWTNLKDKRKSNMDGLLVYAKYAENGMANNFQFDSPSQNNDYNKILRCFVELSKQKVRNKKYVDYFSKLNYIER